MYSGDNYISRNKLLSGYQLAKLHTFEAAARHGSFAMAADELSLSPSAVSHRISALEEELGFKLFERFHRKVVLTADGQRVFWGAQILTGVHQSGDPGDQESGALRYPDHLFASLHRPVLAGAQVG